MLRLLCVMDILSTRSNFACQAGKRSLLRQAAFHVYASCLSTHSTVCVRTAFSRECSPVPCLASQMLRLHLCRWQPAQVDVNPAKECLRKAPPEEHVLRSEDIGSSEPATPSTVGCQVMMIRQLWCCGNNPSSLGVRLTH